MDKLAWGYILAVIVLVFAGAGMLTDKLTPKQWMGAVVAAGAISGATSVIRAKVAAAAEPSASPLPKVSDLREVIPHPSDPPEPPLANAIA